MTVFVAAAWPTEQPVLVARVARLSAHLEACGWRTVFREPGLRVWGRIDRTLRAQPLGGDGGVLLGDVFAKSNGAPFNPVMLRLGKLPDETVARQLSERAWGSYVAMWRLDDGRGLRLLREPCGSVEALMWRRAGLVFASSTLSAPGLSSLLPPIGIDETRLAAIVRNGAEAAGALALVDITAAAPGHLLDARAAQGRQTCIWTPAGAARAAQKAGLAPVEELQRQLSAVVDRCVAAYASPGSTVIAEVSGGLDSAIGASALSRARGAKVGAWLNYHVEDEEGDERFYARAVATRLNVPLSEIGKPSTAFTEEALAAISTTPRPSFNSMDLGYDQDVARRAEALGATRIFTGQGGDTVFFASRTPLIAADARRREGWRTLFSPQLRDLAIQTRQSVWSVMKTAASGDAGLRRRSLCEEPDDPQVHPWLSGVEELPPAKAMQVRDLKFALLFHGECQRSQQALLVHVPLLQPVLEQCLAIPADILGEGGRDRRLARAAFASRLPDVVVNRRGKGDMTAAYGRELSAEAPFLRDYLLGGSLVQRGLVDAHDLEERLHDESLLRSADYADLLDLTATEAWTRRWSAFQSVEPPWM